jgi:NADH-quinone oxidoreductase subunit M
VPNNASLLLISLVLPLVGAGLIALIGRRGHAAVRQSALVTSLITLVIACILAGRFPSESGFFAGTAWQWLPPSSGFDVQFSIGLDGISIWLYTLSALLVVVSVLVSWEAITERASAFYALLLLLETGMLGVFVARDVLLFYIFFEFTLIPLFFLIGIWGSEDRRFAATKFFLYTLAGSLLTFLGLLAIVLYQAWQSPTGVMTFSIPALTAALAANPLPTALQVWIFVALFVGFAIKVPLFPLHTWLPLAHVQAPAAGSIILAGVLLKIGTYGFLRFSIPLLPQATAVVMPVVLWLAVIGIIYGALVALAQSDMKRLIAYSSVSHLGFCMLGLFALNPLGMQGGTLQMINHGLSTGGLFACIGILYERYHTRDMGSLGGVARSMPVLTFFMLVFTFASIGLPGLNGFAGEFLLLAGMFQRGWVGAPPIYAAQFMVIAVAAVFGVLLGAWYMLVLIQRVFFGPVKAPETHGHHAAVSDLSLREVFALSPLVAMIVWIGLWPGFFLDRMNPTLSDVTTYVEQVYRRQYTPNAPLVHKSPQRRSPDVRQAAAPPATDNRALPLPVSTRSESAAPMEVAKQ